MSSEEEKKGHIQHKINSGNPIVKISLRPLWQMCFGQCGFLFSDEPVGNIVDRIQKLGSVLENITNKIESIEIRGKNNKKTTGIERRRMRIIIIPLYTHVCRKFTRNFI